MTKSKKGNKLYNNIIKDEGFLPKGKKIEKVLVKEELMNTIESEELAEEASIKMKPFIEEVIENGKLNIYGGDHGHLNYNDDKFWGHYISPTEDGVEVTVYLKNEIVGDPMNIDGKRGRSFVVDISLDKKFRQKMLDKLEKEIEVVQRNLNIEKNTSVASSFAEYLDKANESVSILKDGLLQ